jgi:similar to spore coat protein
LADRKGIAPHEAFELHELLTFKNVCATKSATMAGLVKDEELKSIMQQDFSVSQGHIRELQNLMQGSTCAVGTSGAATGTDTGTTCH